MGLFSGGFFGSGETKSSSTTNTTTNTTTTVHDIGLTGTAAVDLAAVLSLASRDVTKIGADRDVAIVTDYIDLLKGQSDRLYQEQVAFQDYQGQALQEQGQSYQRLLTTTVDTAQPALSLSKDLLFWLGLIGIGAVVFIGGRL